MHGQHLYSSLQSESPALALLTGSENSGYFIPLFFIP